MPARQRGSSNAVFLLCLPVTALFTIQQAVGVSPLGSVPISDIQSLGILDSPEQSNGKSSSSLQLSSMDTTNYCFEVVLSDRIYSLRAADRLIRVGK